MLRVLGGDSSRLVIDLSCRRVGDGWRVAMDKWQTITGFEINKGRQKEAQAHPDLRLTPRREHCYARTILQRVPYPCSRC